jgi:hypothetical protein
VVAEEERWWGECTGREKEERERFEVVSQTLNF